MLLRWPGSKRKAAKTIASYAPSSRHYREAFCGNASILWELSRGRTIWLNDIHPVLMNYYRALVSNDNCLAEGYIALVSTIDSEQKMRDIFEEMKPRYRDHDCPLALLYLSRLALGQIVSKKRPNTCSFGEKWYKSGLKPVHHARFDQARAILLAGGPKITCGDYAPVLNAPGDDVWIFIDAPYFIPQAHHHSSPLYEYSFDIDDQVRLCETLKRCQHKCLATVGNSTFENLLYRAEDFQSPYRSRPGFRIVRRPYTYAGVRRSRQPRKYELLVMNYD